MTFQRMHAVVSRGTLIQTYLLLHRVGLHSGGSSLSGWFLLGMWSECERICNHVEEFEDLL